MQLPIAGADDISYERISADSIKKHVEYLGSDSLQGRGTGTTGGNSAAQYIADQLQKYQLKPMGDNQTFFQSIPMRGSIPLPESELLLFSQNDMIELELKKDYLLYKSGASTFIPQAVPLVFVGYGIIAPEFDYNDYQSVNVEGKIAVFLTGEPTSEDSTYFDGADPTIYSYPESKQRLAISRGAQGSILIPTDRIEKYKNWNYWVNTFAFEDVALAYSVTANLSLLMNPDAAEKLFTDSPYSLSEIFDMEHRNTIRSFELNTSISFQGRFLRREFLASNVIGLLPGTNPKPETQYLIISAHYDHLGIGMAVEGDSIYNGVFDNAVGVAAVLEIARVFSSNPNQPKHSILFLFTTGEEKGLLGSQYYVDHPIVPLYKTIANVNMDGLSMLDEFETVIGVGSEYSTLGNELAEVARKFGVKTTAIPSEFIASESFARSDQISFAKAGIPSLLIAEGLKLKNYTETETLQKYIDWYENIYHSPFDDLNQPMNFSAAQQHCRFIYAFCYHIANSEELPQWKAGSPFINARLRSIAEQR